MLLGSCSKQTPCPVLVPPEARSRSALPVFSPEFKPQHARTRRQVASTRHSHRTESYLARPNLLPTRHRAPSTHPPIPAAVNSEQLLPRLEALPPRPPHPSPPPRVCPRLAGAPRRLAIAAGARAGRSAARGPPNRASPELFALIRAGFWLFAARPTGGSGWEGFDACGGFGSRALSCVSAMPGWSGGDC